LYKTQQAAIKFINMDIALVIIHCLEFLKTHFFWKLDVYVIRYKGAKDVTELGPLEIAALEL
jgi:hypothetical protein